MPLTVRYYKGNHMIREQKVDENLESSFVKKDVQEVEEIWDELGRGGSSIIEVIAERDAIELIEDALPMITTAISSKVVYTEPFSRLIVANVHSIFLLEGQ